MKKIARIKDIAIRAGVSPGTVDRVLHSRGRVSEKARDRIENAMKELNYEPNILARALVSSHEWRIAALIPDPSNDEYWEAPFNGVEMAESQLRQYGVAVDKYLFNQKDVQSFTNEAQKINPCDYRGIVTAPLFYRESLAYLKKWNDWNVPLCLFNTHIPDYKPVAYVGQDSYQSGMLAGRLLHYGCKKPGTFIVTHIDDEVTNSSHLIKKEKGFIDFFGNLGAEGFNVVRTEIDFWEDEERCHNHLEHLYKKYPDLRGFFVTNSRSFVIGDFLQRRGVEDLQLVGYDLLSKNREFLNRGVIDFLINQNPHGQGYMAVMSMADHVVFRKAVDQIKYLPLDVVMKENLKYYI